jgi:hypothetical protein
MYTQFQSLVSTSPPRPTKGTDQKKSQNHPPTSMAGDGDVVDGRLSVGFEIAWFFILWITMQRGDNAAYSMIAFSHVTVSSPP